MSGASTAPGAASRVRKYQYFFASGTWTPPNANTYCEAIVIGGGGGGQNGDKSTNGANGVNTTFGALATGLGASGANTGGTTGLLAGQGAMPTNALAATDSSLFGPGTLSPGYLGQFGAGGAGGFGFRFNEGAGTWPTSGAAGYSALPVFFTGSVSAAQTVTIGTGGLGGASNTSANGVFQAGQNGTQGIVIVAWLE